MKLGDLLNLAGDLPLESFTWGHPLVNSLNISLSLYVREPSQLIKTGHTGKQALLRLHVLPAELFAQLIVREYDVIKTLWVDEETQPAQPLQAPSVTTPLPPTTRPFTAMAMGTMLTLMALMTAANVNTQLHPDQVKVESGVLSKSVKLFADILATLFK